MMSNYGHDITLFAIDKSLTKIHKITYRIMNISGVDAIIMAEEQAGENYKYAYAITALKEDISDVGDS